MIYQAKPQRGGRSIPVNTNNPPQDPPAPPLDLTAPDVIVPDVIVPDVIVPVEVPVIDVVEIPQIIPPIKIAKVKITKKPKATTIPTTVHTTIPTTGHTKLTILQKISKFFKYFFRMA